MGSVAGAGWELVGGLAREPFEGTSLGSTSVARMARGPSMSAVGGAIWEPTGGSCGGPLGGARTEPVIGSG